MTDQDKIENLAKKLYLVQLSQVKLGDLTHEEIERLKEICYFAAEVFYWVQ